MYTYLSNLFSGSIPDKKSSVLLIDTEKSNLYEQLKSDGLENLTLACIDPDSLKAPIESSDVKNNTFNSVYLLIQEEFDYAIITPVINECVDVHNLFHILKFLVNNTSFVICSIDNTYFRKFSNNSSKYNVLELLSGLGLGYDIKSINNTNLIFASIDCNQARSTLRKNCDKFIIRSSVIINASISKGSLLYVSTAGDPVGGEYTALFPNFEIMTADSDPAWNPDIVVDITNTNFDDSSWDVVLISNVIEHVPNLQLLTSELTRVIKQNGFLLIDCPWNYPYHAEPPSFGDYWRISLDGFDHLFGNNFQSILIEQTENSSHLLGRRR